MNSFIKEYINNLYNEIERILILQLEKLNVPNDDEIIKRHCFKIEGNQISIQNSENYTIAKYFFEDILLLTFSRNDSKHIFTFPEIYSDNIKSKVIKYLNN